MKRITLTVRDRRDGEVLLALEWRGAQTVMLQAAPRYAQAAELWLQRGLREWIGPRGEEVPRTTSAAAAEFLPRLHAHLTAQFSLLSIDIAERFDDVPELGPATVRTHALNAESPIANTVCHHFVFQVA